MAETLAERAQRELDRREAARAELQRRGVPIESPPLPAVDPGLSPPRGMARGGLPLEALFIGAGRAVDRLGSNIGQAFAEMFGDDTAAAKQKAKQAEIERLAEPIKREFPIQSFAGEALPFFAVPGGLPAQIGAGVAQGALEGDDPTSRLIGGGLGGALGFAGQKAGDVAGSRVQNALQRLMGNPNANARKALLDAGVPLNLSERTDSAISKPLARFFERGRFVWTGKQPKGAAQQERLTELVTDALGVNAKKLTRETIGKAVGKNKAVFKNAADRIGAPIFPDDELLQTTARIKDEFRRVGSDSSQVTSVFDDFVRSVEGPDGIDPDIYLRMRSELSEATTKSGLETHSLVDAVTALDDQVARLRPELADDLRIARDRFRLLLAIRKGAALSPQGDINVASFTKNLERVFRDFDANKPLPGTLRAAGEAIAGFNQVANPFRSSGTAENTAAAAIPALSAIDPGGIGRFLAAGAVPFAGGGAGGQIGGGVARGGLLEMLLQAEQQKRQ